MSFYSNLKSSFRLRSTPSHNNLVAPVKHDTPTASTPLESLQERGDISSGVRWFVGCIKPATLIGGMQGWRGSWRLSLSEAL